MRIVGTSVQKWDAESLGVEVADFIESARVILSQSERRMEATANNVANLTTSGFKSQRLYSAMSADANGRAPNTSLQQSADLSQGRLMRTDRTLDIAISGPGMFRLSSSDGTITYSRSGQFSLSADGRVVNGVGLALQSADGGDIVLSSSDISILADGTILEGERPVAKIGVFRASEPDAVRALGGASFAIAGGVEDVAAPELRQGMLEASNVALADEMVTMMEVMRQAEGGARLVQTYDDLIGKAVQTFGQGSR